MKITFLALIVVLTIFSSCEKEDPVIPNEEEVITTLEYTMVGSMGDTAVFTWRDLDGDGPNAPVITHDTLMPNATYTGSCTLWNETETPAENVTIEIQDEADEHQFFFSTTVTDLVFGYADTDSNGLPVGLQTTITTPATMAHGTFTVTLKHEPVKTAANVSSGDMTNAGGSTDIEATFDVHIH
ncbi:MAG: type 1 periplasmic binding fold superfamily protein [Saprospiraceae bacterium]|nr:type 1 periplasmic binding fold superfamily protein [Saprospiraceae bacterium]